MLNENCDKIVRIIPFGISKCLTSESSNRSQKEYIKNSYRHAERKIMERTAERAHLQS